MDKIHAHIILEILGRPKEHVSEALTGLVLRLGTEKGVKVINKTIHPPVPVQESQTLFTTFAEVEIEFDSIEYYIAVLFGYMPSHIEIVSPERMVLANTSLAEMGNALVSRLHNYDAITKNVLSERDFLLEKIKEISPETFKKLTTPPEQKSPPIVQKKKKPSKSKKKKSS